MLADNRQVDKRTTMMTQNRSAALGRPAMKLLGASTSLQATTLALSSALVPQSLSYPVCMEDFLLIMHYLRNIEIRIKTKIKQKCYNQSFYNEQLSF